MLDQSFFDAAWELFDPKESITYIPYDNITDTNIDANKIECVDALITEEDKIEKQYGDLSATYNHTRTWYLRVAHLNGTNVTARGMILDADGTQWIIISVTLRTVKTRWKCECYALNR